MNYIRNKGQRFPQEKERLISKETMRNFLLEMNTYVSSGMFVKPYIQNGIKYRRVEK